MTRTIVVVSSWLAAGGVLLAGLYWLFLITPESNQLTLAASALLGFGMIAFAAVTLNGAILLSQNATFSVAARRGLIGSHWFVMTAIPVILAWVLTRRGDAWMTTHSGEISAWFIATFGWADVTALFRIELWVSRWLRWVVFPVASISLLSALLSRGFAGLGDFRWLTRAWSWRTLSLATVAFLALLTLPWQMTMWRPSLPPTWVEAAVAGLRLGIAAILIVVGCALIVSIATRPDEHSPAEAART